MKSRHENRIKTAAAALLLACWSHTARAEGIFVEAALTYAGLEIAGEEFNPSLARIQAGWYWEDGLAVVGQAAGSIDQDAGLGFEAGIDSLASAFLRFESPELGGFRLAILGGYSQTRVALERGAGRPTESETFTSPALGLVAAQRLGQSPWSLTADYIRHYNREQVDVRTFSLGLRYDLR